MTTSQSLERASPSGPARRPETLASWSFLGRCVLAPGHRAASAPLGSTSLSCPPSTRGFRQPRAVSPLECPPLSSFLPCPSPASLQSSPPVDTFSCPHPRHPLQQHILNIYTAVTVDRAQSSNTQNIVDLLASEQITRSGELSVIFTPASPIFLRPLSLEAALSRRPAEGSG